ncbi:hypothetical protein VTN96DRAFT_1940 [Rasamsonia emersonii]
MMDNNIDSRYSRADTDVSPVTTDSMVTVPLSDRQSNPNGVCHDSRTLDIPETPIEEKVDGEGLISEDGENPLETTPKNEDIFTPAPETKERRESASSAKSQSSRQSQEEPGSPAESDGVDWAKLDETEEQEPRNEATDESTALLLARLEQENNALVTNPKSGLANAARPRRPSRPPSIQQLKRLVNDHRSSLRYSQLPPPPMTELEFWAALVADYPMTAQRLPTLTSNKIRAGVPPPLRGVVWPSIAGARDTQLLEDFRRLSGESSPYEGLIGKDIGRSFPNVEMFRDPNGEGQQMLARVLKCFSLYDTKIGYCQGLGFVVGPLLMHMSDAEAFCVLVRLMDHYKLRSCFLPDLSGLHLRIYQFQSLLSRHLPSLYAHLESLHVEPVYVSQWFLSFFAVTCPLPMLLRIYDVLLLEGAAETLMRVALSLMQRNEKKIMACTEFEDVLQLLLSRNMWDTYGWNADDLVNDFVSLTPLVTKESLQALEASYNQSQGVSTGISFPQMQAAASRFLGRLWAGSNSHNSAKSLNLNPPNAARPESTVRRSPSKQSMASTLNSMESASSEASTAATEVSTPSGGDSAKMRTKSGLSHKDKDLHGQIEDLLMALGDLQREQAELARELQREREEREEDHEVAKAMLAYIKDLDNKEDSEELIAKAEERFAATSKRVSIMQTKHQLRDEANRWKEKHDVEAARCLDLTRRIDEFEIENARLKEDLREARQRIQDGHRDRQRLERTIQELRHRKYSHSDSTHDSSSGESSDVWPSPGLREIKLVSRAGSQKSNKYPKRNSSLGLQSVPGGESQANNNAPAGSGSGSNSEDALLLELVNAKTAEAVAKQELEEVKAKLDSLRRLISNQAPTTPRPSVSTELSSHHGGSSPRSSPEQSKASTLSSGGGGGGGGGFFGWGKRTVSTASFS